MPAPDDVLGRALAYYASVPVRRAVGVGDVPGGVAVLDPDFAHSRDNNRLVLTEPVDAATIEAAAEEVGGNAGWPYLAAALLWPDAAEVAAELGRRGWATEELLLMARPAGPVRGVDRAEVVPQQAVHEFWTSSWRQSLAGLGPQLDQVVAQLVGREHLNDRVVDVRDVVVRENGRVVASGQLRIDGATAAVDSVLTDPAARGRGYADAVLARSLDLAAGAGCDLVVLEAAADDWPRDWYARRGSRWSARRGPWTAPRGSDRREHRQEEVGDRRRGQQRVQPVHQAAVPGQQVTHVLDAEVALDQRLAEVAEGGGDGERRPNSTPPHHGPSRASAIIGWRRPCRPAPSRPCPPTTSSG